VCQNPSNPSLGEPPSGMRTVRYLKPPRTKSRPRQLTPFLSVKYKGRSRANLSVVVSPYRSANSGDSEYVNATYGSLIAVVTSKQTLEKCQIFMRSSTPKFNLTVLRYSAETRT
jgi:hypothetical protein